MKKKDRKELYSLLETWTKSEIISRFCPFKWIDFGEAAFEKIKAENKIRKLLYGTSDLVELGKQWRLPIRTDKKKSKRK